MERFWNILKGKGIGRKKLPTHTTEYSKVYETDFSSLPSKDWRTSHIWGWVAVDVNLKAKEYTGLKKFSKPTLEGLKLECKHKPISIDTTQHDFLHHVPSPLNIEWGRGMVESKFSYKYGIFSSDIILPKNVHNIWPAFWLTGLTNWPPEIDIIEAYSGKDGKYRSGWLNLKNRAFKPNIYFKKRGKTVNYKTYPCHIKDFGKGPINFTLWWEKDFIRIYYAYELVMEVTNKKILEQMDEPMKVIFNNGTHSLDKLPNQDSTVVVKNLNIFQKKTT